MIEFRYRSEGNNGCSIYIVLLNVYILLSRQKPYSHNIIQQNIRYFFHLCF